VKFLVIVHLSGVGYLIDRPGRAGRGPTHNVEHGCRTFGNAYEFQMLIVVPVVREKQ